METVSISGFGGSYEWVCQRMLQLGMEWLKAHADFNFSAYFGFKHIYGIVAIDDKNPQRVLAEELDNLITTGDPILIGFGVTGAMHQAVIGHLSYIHKNGYRKWLEELHKRIDHVQLRARDVHVFLHVFTLCQIMLD